MRLRGILGIVVLAAATAAAVAAPVRVNKVQVARSADGLSVEVIGAGPLSAKATKLAGPDRIVLDIADSVLTGPTRQIAVNTGDVKDVRVALYQSAPPTTRIVVDMAAMHEYEVLSAGNMLVLKLKNADVASNRAPAQKAANQQQLAQAPVTAKSVPAPVSVAKADPPVPVAPTAPASEKAANLSANSKSGSPLTVTLLSGLDNPAAAQNKGDQAASHLVKPADPVMVSSGKPPLAASGSLSAEPAVVNAVLQQQQQAVTTPATTSSSCTSGHYSGAPLNLDLKDLDIKDFFRLIHEISGLNVVLDPGVRGIVTIDVTDIPWDQALAIVLRNNGLECELEGNVLRVATLETLRAEADARRAQQEAQAMAVPRQNYTRYLSYAHSKDLVTVIKKFLSPRGDVVSDDRSNAIIIEDIPTTLPKVDALLTAMDRKTPEVEIEARVVSAQRSFARDIGTQIGLGFGNGTTAVGGGTATPSPIQNNVKNPEFITIPSQAAQIPLFTNLPAVSPTSGIGFTTATAGYRLDFILTAAESRGLVKVLSRPRVVTQNNIAATIRQGQQIPVVTAAQLGGPPTVSYINAFLRLTVTPQITSDNTIFLLVDVENTTADFSHVTAAQLNPALDTQQATTQVLVSDGQTVVIGGVIQTQNNLAVNQVPVLGSIPLLGNLFKETSINTSTSELLFFITPKIIQT